MAITDNLNSQPRTNCTPELCQRLSVLGADMLPSSSIYTFSGSSHHRWNYSIRKFAISTKEYNGIIYLKAIDHVKTLMVEF